MGSPEARGCQRSMEASLPPENASVTCRNRRQLRDIGVEIVHGLEWIRRRHTRQYGLRPVTVSYSS